MLALSLGSWLQNGSEEEAFECVSVQVVLNQLSLCMLNVFHNLPEGWTSETLQAPLRAYAQQLSSYPTCFSLLAVAALIAACV